MSEVFILSTRTQNKILKYIQKKFSEEGLQCKILKSPHTAIQKVKECFSLYYKKIPRLKSYKIGGINIHPETFILARKSNKIRLRKKEFELFQFLISNKNKIINRNTILENVWGLNSNLFTNTVDVHIASLRKKLAKIDFNHLKTIHGVGYKLEM